MALPPRPSAAPLAIIALSAVAGHAFLWAPLAQRADADSAVILLEPGDAPPPMRELPPGPDRAMWVGPFIAERVDPGTPWRAAFHGRTAIGPAGTIVELERSTFEAGARIRGGRVASLRLGLAEPTPDGGWRVVREGPAVPLGAPVRAHRTTLFSTDPLHLPGAGWDELEGRWLVVTVETETAELGRSVTHVHMDRGLTHALADRARSRFGPRARAGARR